MLLKEALPIAADETAATLHDKLAAQGARLIVAALARLDELVPETQPAAGVSYAGKIEKREAVIDWTLPAAVIERRLRAFDPFPGCVGALRGETLKLWRGRIADARGGPDKPGAPGEVLAADASGIVVACGEGALALTELQKPGGRRLAAAEFLRGCAVAAGERFDTPA
jgi:methionyl-tRNA formyltransferase